MTEHDARTRALADVPRETAELLQRYVGILTKEASAQNLVSAATIGAMWNRHILDSAQLARLDRGVGQWIDIGSGAGLPGIVVKLVTPRPMLLVEPRALRARFLEHAVASLGLTETDVAQTKAERIERPPAAVISARAVASISDLFAMAAHLADDATRWILPKGRSAQTDVAEARRLWHAEFGFVPSLTDPDATIVIATQVRARNRR